MTISSNKHTFEEINNLQNRKFPPDLGKIYDQRLTNQLANTTGAIQGLNQTYKLLQNPNLLMRPILVKEAEASSQLEGTQASIEDAYKIDVIEQTPEKKNEALEIINYQEAMLTGIDIIKKYGFSPLLIREVHKRLLHGVRGYSKHPGEFRKGDVWIGPVGTVKEKARYLPPDASQVPVLMEQLHIFINNRGDIHPLLACGIIHHRFEAIHPFEDENGRTGRLLISLYLLSQNLLTYPILYPSGYFEKDKKSYTDALSIVDENENWYAWLMYFLKGMEQQANLSLKVASDIDSLFKESKKVIEKERANINLIRVLEFSYKRPYLTSATVNKSLQISRASCDRYLNTLASRHVIVDAGIHKRERLFVNLKLLNLLKNI